MAKGKYLNRQSYLDAAMNVIAEIGVDKLSMRKVADHLGVSAMAVYKHFDNKNELLACAFDEFISRADVFPPEDINWQQWISHVGNGMYDALCAESSWLPLLGSISIGQHGVTVTESFVRKLTRSGFSNSDAIEAYFGVIHLVIGAASMHSTLTHYSASSLADVGADLRQYAQSFDPNDDHLADQMIAMVQRKQIDIGLPMLIDALGKRLN